jgi:hypothetical protein
MAEAGEIKVRVKLETESGEPFDVQRLRLDPGDVIVLTSRRAITAESGRKIRQLAEEIFVGHRVMILSELEIKVAGAGPPIPLGPDS